MVSEKKKSVLKRFRKQQLHCNPQPQPGFQIQIHSPVTWAGSTGMRTATGTKLEGHLRKFNIYIKHIIRLLKASSKPSWQGLRSPFCTGGGTPPGIHCSWVFAGSVAGKKKKSLPKGHLRLGPGRAHYKEPAATASSRWGPGAPCGAGGAAGAGVGARRMDSSGISK